MGVDRSDNRNLNRLIQEAIIKEGKELKSLGYYLLIIGDFNGHIGENDDGIPGGGKVNENGQLIINLVNGMDLVIGNKLRQCKGKWTWSKGTQQSIIDYALLDNEVATRLLSMNIDDISNNSIGSDHNLMILDVAQGFYIGNNFAKTKETWKLNDNINWESFNEQFSLLAADWEALLLKYRK